MNENRMIMIMFFIIDSVEFESGMCVIYRNIQWILLAWHAFFILSSTCKHDKTLCVALTSAVRVGICFFGPFFLQLSFFVLNSCPKLCTYLFWFWKRICHSRTYSMGLELTWRLDPFKQPSVNISISNVHVKTIENQQHVKWRLLLPPLPHLLQRMQIWPLCYVTCATVLKSSRLFTCNVEVNICNMSTSAACQMLAMKARSSSKNPSTPALRWSPIATHI